ncbi:MAG: hypothetical protein J5486_04105 [Bacteroidaceae bacterium]|nr:hypothetical protein [Bacteroidaceae bacterium]
MDSRIQIIDVFGQFQDKGSGHYYTYPAQPQDEATTEWKRFINDPRELPPTLSQPAYAIWCTSRGWWVAQVQKNGNDTRGGFAMAALFLGSNRPADGTQLVKLLSLVSAKYIDSMSWTDSTLADSVVQPGALSLIPCPVHPFTLGQPSAYRTFSSPEERDAALTFIDQKGYDAFSRIFIIPLAAVAQPAAMQSSRMTDVTRQIPIQRVFVVQCPAGVRANKAQVLEHDKVQLVYSASGADDVIVEVTAGQNTPYAVYQGNTLVVQPASNARITFAKHFSVKLSAVAGGVEKDITDFTLQSSSTNVRINGNVVSFPAAMQGELSLAVTHPNFESREVQVKLQELANGGCVKVQTKSKGYKVAFVLDDLGVVESTKTVGKTSQEYRILTDQYHATLNNNRLCLNVPRSRASFNDYVVYEPSPLQRMKWPAIFALVLTCLLAVYGIYAIVRLSMDEFPYPFPMNTEQKASSSYDDSEEAVQDDVIETDNEGSEVAGVTETVDQQALEHDIDYMKRENAWERDSLQSKHFQNMYDVIKNGEVAVLRETNWFEGVDDGRINGFWLQVMKSINTIQGNDAAIADKLRRSDDPDLKKDNRDNIAIGFLAGQLKQLGRGSSTGGQNKDRGSQQQQQPAPASGSKSEQPAASPANEEQPDLSKH